IEATEERLTELEEELVRARLELRHSDPRNEVPSEAELARRRARRADGGELVRRALAGEDVIKEAVAWGKGLPLWVAYLEASDAADRYVDELRSRTAEVARRDQAELQLESLTNRRANLQRALASQGRRREEILANWRVRWASCGFVPLAPRPMAAWLQDF